MSADDLSIDNSALLRNRHLNLYSALSPRSFCYRWIGRRRLPDRITLNDASGDFMYLGRLRLRRLWSWRRRRRGRRWAHRIRPVLHLEPHLKHHPAHRPVPQRSRQPLLAWIGPTEASGIFSGGFVGGVKVVGASGTRTTCCCAGGGGAAAGGGGGATRVVTSSAPDSCGVKRYDRCGYSHQNQQCVNCRCSGQERACARIILTVPLRLD